MIDIKHIFELYKEKRVKLESESRYRQMWSVDGHIVVIQIKKRRRVLTCDCNNHTRYCNSSALCRHKEAVVAFPIINKMLEELNKKISNVNALKFDSNKEVSNMASFILNELEDFNKLRWVKQLKSK